MIALWSAQRFGSAFPYGTLIVNLGGCFIIAASMHAALALDEIRALVSALDYVPSEVRATSDRHWTWKTRRT